MDSPELLNDRYLLIQPLASGGMAHVWLGEDRLLGRPVAVKILREEFTRRPDFQKRFRSEAQAVARLSHPNLVTVYDFGIQDDRYYMVLEYVEGEDLKSHMRRIRAEPGEAPAWTEWASIALQISEGLGVAHRAGLIHCDVKPQNVLLGPDRRAKVTDFGIARVVAQDAAGEGAPPPAGPQTSGRTETTVWGSPQYFSPEQAAGEPLAPASDVYSTGVVLFEMLTGRLPFPGHDPRTLALQHLHEPPPRPSLLNPAVPPALEEIVLRAMAKDAAERYRNGEQMARVLHGLLAPQAAPAPLVRAPARAPVEAPPGGETLALEEEQPPAIVDWKAVVLAFLGLIAVGGLIPFWVYVYFLYNPPGH